MGAVALVLLAVALADLPLGLAGERLHGEDPIRTLSWAGATVAVFALTAVGGLGLRLEGAAFLLGVAAAAVFLCWSGARRWVSSTESATDEQDRARTALAGCALLLVALIASAPAWPAPADGALTSYLARMAPGTSAAAATLVAALLVAQLATANGVVRLVLSASGTLREAAAEPVAGGRWIGPAERVLLVLLILGGEITAAGLITAAKGLLRRDTASNDYVVLGTLVSLSLGLVPALVIRGLV